MVFSCFSSVNDKTETNNILSVVKAGRVDRSVALVESNQYKNNNNNNNDDNDNDNDNNENSPAKKVRRADSKKEITRLRMFDMFRSENPTQDFPDVQLLSCFSNTVCQRRYPTLLLDSDTFLNVIRFEVNTSSEFVVEKAQP